MVVQTRSQTNRARAELAGIPVTDKTPTWATQVGEDLGDLPDPASKGDEYEEHLLPASPNSITPVVINGVEVPRSAKAYRKSGVKGIQVVIQEGPPLHARVRLVKGAVLPRNLDRSSLQLVKAPAVLKAKDREGKPEVVSVWAVAFRDPNNEGPRVLISSPRTQLIVGVTWSDGAKSWETKSAVTRFLQTKSTGFLYDIASRAETKFEKYMTRIKSGKPQSPPPSKPTSRSTSPTSRPPP